MAGNSRKSIMLSSEQLEELCDNFQTLDKDGNGYLDVSELKHALDMVGFKIPQWQVRQMIEEMEKNHIGSEKGTIGFGEFQKLYSELKSKEVSVVFKTAVSKRENLDTLGGMSEASSMGTTHSVRHEEQVAFSDWINTNLGSDPDLKHLLPIDLEGKTLFDKVEDGILLCKIINHSCADTIDERAINKKNLTLYTKHENLTLALNSSQAIGCNIINIDASDLANKKPHLVLGLLWQIIRIGLFNQITLEHCPGLVQLVQPGEEMSDLMKLSPENILLRWVNYHLEKSGTNRRITNFQTDIKDSEIYTYLLKQISPISSGVTMEALRHPDYLERAETMLKQADKIGCRSFLAPRDVVDGVYKLNVAFVANLFNNHPALDKPEEPIEFVNLEETREEKTYRNWMNSMGVSPYVNWIYSDLADGLVIFQGKVIEGFSELNPKRSIAHLYDIIKPNMVDWNRVHKTFSKLKAFMEKLENCNYVVSLGKQLKFSLVGIAGQDIFDGNPTLTLAVVWQLMRAYTLSLLTRIADTGHPIVEREIVEWVNNKLKEADKQSSIRNFQDPSISNARPIIDLIDAIRPGSINYAQVLSGKKPEDRMTNAKYAISMARKIGARIYALPEDITEVKLKMVMTVFACLMARDYIPNMGAKNNSENSE